ncbi:hypothetical protein RCO48_12085 [Peribacillus frigoritolerans]|nr:hypothetical protein [Peribacillus frigoritolerans]
MLFFQSAVMKSSLPIYWLYLLVSLVFAWIIDFKLVTLFFHHVSGCGVFFLVYMKRKIVSWFGGITGGCTGGHPWKGLSFGYG